jgi:Mg2+-importing ATPase
MTQLFIVMVIRTRRTFVKSRPGNILFATTLIVSATAVALPYTPLGSMFGLVPLPALFMLALLGITLLYLLASEAAKQVLFARLDRQAREAEASLVNSQRSFER